MVVSLFLILLALLCVWVLIVYLIKEKGGDAFSLWGPILLWKTEKGKALIDRIAQKRAFWKKYGDIAIVVCGIAMVVMFALILWNIQLSFKIPPQSAPSPRLLIGLPGLNPIIPIGYGVIALAVAMIVHELSHGILARVEKIKVKALGLIFLIVPIGAFVEPDEEELEKVSRKKRSHVFAAGPMSNIILCVICLLILAFVLAPSIAPKTEGVIVGNDFHGIETWSVISGVDGIEIKERDNFLAITDTFEPGTFYNATLYYKDDIKEKQFFYGVYVRNIVDDSPAAETLHKGSIIYKLTHRSNETLLADEDAFHDVMNSTHADEEIMVEYYYNGNVSNASFLLADKYYFTKNEEDKGKGFLGIGAYGINDIVFNTDYYPKLLRPFKGRFLSYLALPFLGLSPLPEELATIYTPSDTFWITYNVLYWIFWLNFALGTFNVLPAVPLDGGIIFRDGLDYIIGRIKGDWKKEKINKVARTVTTVFSVIVLISILAIILVPRLRLLF